MLIVSGSYQNYQNATVSYKLTGIGMGEYVGVNQLMCDRGGALYSVHATV
jgi:hypothetical protein